MPAKLILVGARISFAEGLFTPKALEDNQTPKYGADFIIEADTKVLLVKADGTKTTTTLKDAELLVAKEAWKGKAETVLESLERSKKAHRNGNFRVNKSGEVYDGYEDKWYVTAKSSRAPTVIDSDKSPLTARDGKPYSGCYVIAHMDIYANGEGTKRGVFAGLTGVQFYKHGDAFGGGAPASVDDFDDLSEGAGADDLG